MTMPAYKSVGTGHETAPAWPTHIAGDFGMLFTENDADTIATPSGWSVVPGTPVVGIAGNQSRLQVFYKFATSSSETTPAISATNHSWGVVITFTNVNRLNPVHNVSVHYRPSGPTLVNCPGVNTYTDNSLVVAGFAWHSDSAGPFLTTPDPSNAGLANVLKRFDAGTTTGNGGGLIIVTGELATHTTIGPTSINLTGATALAMACIALQADDLNFGIKGRIVNTRM